MRFHSACWGLCPKAHGGNFLNQMLCCGATVLQIKGSPNGLSQEMCSKCVQYGRFMIVGSWA